MQKQVSGLNKGMGRAYARPASKSLLGEIKKNSMAYLFILPAMVGIFAVILVPLAQAIIISFKRYYILDILREDPPFIGLANYATILSDPQFWYSLRITIWFTFACVALTMLFGLLIAILLDQDFPRKRHSYSLCTGTLGNPESRLFHPVEMDIR